MGDGNCLFRSLAHPSHDHADVRRRILRHIRRNWDKYSMFMEDSEQATYLENMARNGTWGDELIISAYSDAYGVDVHVHDTRHNTVLRYGREYPTFKHVRYDGGHYDVLLPGS